MGTPDYGCCATAYFKLFLNKSLTNHAYLGIIIKYKGMFWIRREVGGESKHAAAARTALKTGNAN